MGGKTTRSHGGGGCGVRCSQVGGEGLNIDVWYPPRSKWYPQRRHTYHISAMFFANLSQAMQPLRRGGAYCRMDKLPDNSPEPSVNQRRPETLPPFIVLCASVNANRNTNTNTNAHTNTSAHTNTNPYAGAIVRPEDSAPFIVSQSSCICVFVFVFVFVFYLYLYLYLSLSFICICNCVCICCICIFVYSHQYTGAAQRQWILLLLYFLQTNFLSLYFIQTKYKQNLWHFVII